MQSIDIAYACDVEEYDYHYGPGQFPESAYAEAGTTIDHGINRVGLGVCRIA